MAVRGLDGNTTAERVTKQEDLFLDADGLEKSVDPVRIPGEGELTTRKIGRSAEAGKGGRIDPAPERDQPVDGLAVGAITEGPTVEEHHREGRAAARQLARPGRFGDSVQR